MKKRLTVLICNDMRGPSDPIVVTVSGETPDDIRNNAMIAHAEAEMADFDGDPMTAADLWAVSRAYIFAAIPGTVDFYYVGMPSDTVDNYDHVMGECLEESPLCTMND